MAGNQSNSTRIVVIGGGVIGLTTALALLEDDFKHVQLISESFDDTTSHGAGAVWRPFALPSHISTHRIRY
jgi:D-amino-acid oxidase